MSLYKFPVLGLISGLMTVSSALGRTVVGTETKFNSPQGVSESCVISPKLPMGKYSEDDLETEKKFCSLDFYNNSVALCPKTWSTSAATIVRDNSKTGKSSPASESSVCVRNSPLDSIAKFKQTMNQVDTSGTFSLSNILYYHFARVLDTTVDVSVAVYRTMDKDEHYRRVSSKAKPPAAAKMNMAGWKHLRGAEKTPSDYSAAGDLFTSDLKKIYGTVTKDKGERYEAEFNGTRARGWGKGQNLDFQATPGFMALRSEEPMSEAIQDGVRRAFKNSAMAKAFGSERPSDTQVVLWMKELSEIVILDFIFSQQDRVGNIDYRWYWVYSDAAGKVKTLRVKSELPLLKKGLIKVPSEIAHLNPVLVQKTFIGDNDAGGLVKYANFTKTTEMLEKIRHLHPETYQRLHQLALDLESKGPNYQVIAKSYGLETEEINQILTNTKMALSILMKSCESGKLRFDLVSYKNAYLKNYKEATLNCRNP